MGFGFVPKRVIKKAEEPNAETLKKMRTVKVKVPYVKPVRYYRKIVGTLEQARQEWFYNNSVDEAQLGDGPHWNFSMMGVFCECLVAAGVKDALSRVEDARDQAALQKRVSIEIQKGLEKYPFFNGATTDWGNNIEQAVAEQWCGWLEAWMQCPDYTAKVGEGGGECVKIVCEDFVKFVKDTCKAGFLVV